MKIRLADYVDKYEKVKESGISGKKIKIKLCEDGDIKHYFVVYTAAFVVLALILFFPFYSNGKSLVWNIDGWDQHFKALVYYGRYLRGLVRNLVQNHSLTVPAFSFHLGYGADILTTLHYYCVGDPLDLTAVFVPERYMHLLYGALIILRMYLAGIVFSHYCIYMKKQESMSVMAGALAYAFCGFGLVYMRHPFFLNPLIYFPLILLGVERIWKEKKPWLFVGSVCLSAVTSFYFFYMMVILTVLYVVIRLTAMYMERRQEGYKFIVSRLLTVGGYSVVGVMLSAFLLLPVILCFLDGPRSGTKCAYGFLPFTRFLEELPASFLSYGIVNVGSAIALLAVSLLFLRKGNRQLKIAFIMLTIFYIIPFFGHVFNGFAYSTNRWLWGYAMLTAFIIVAMWEEFLTISPRENILLLLIAGIYFIVCMLLRQSVTKNMGFAMVLVFLAIHCMSLYRQKEIKRWMMQCLLGGVMVAGMIGNVYFGWSMYEGNYVSEFVDSENIYERLTNNIGAAVKANDTGDTGPFYRYSGAIGDRNAMLLDGLSGTQYYWSMAPGNLFDYTKELEVQDNTVLTFLHLDKRAILNTLAGVKYLINDPYSKTAERTVPYAYTEIDAKDWGLEGRCRVYRDDLTMPLGYTYTTYITPETFAALPAIEKQEAMLQGVYLEQKPVTCQETEIVTTSREIDYTLECNNEQVSVQGDDFVVTQGGASVTLTFDGMENAETYLRLEGLDYSSVRQIDLYNDDLSIDPNGLYTKEAWKEIPLYTRNRQRMDARYWQPAEMTIMVINSVNANEEEVGTSLAYLTPWSWTPTGRHDFLVNIGYDEQRKQSITITFNDIGIYHIDRLQVLCQPMDHYVEQVSALRKDVLQQTDMHEIAGATNCVTGTITVDEPKLLCLTVPYSEGWEAYVDGEKQELLKANIMFCAIELTPGQHDICLRYHTPGMRLGMIISAAGLLISLGICLYRRMKRA